MREEGEWLLQNEELREGEEQYLHIGGTLRESVCVGGRG